MSNTIPTNALKRKLSSSKRDEIAHAIRDHEIKKRKVELQERLKPLRENIFKALRKLPAYKAVVKLAGDSSVYGLTETVMAREDDPSGSYYLAVQVREPGAKKSTTFRVDDLAGVGNVVPKSTVEFRLEHPDLAELEQVTSQLIDLENPYGYDSPRMKLYGSLRQQLTMMKTVGDVVECWPEMEGVVKEVVCPNEEVDTSAVIRPMSVLVNQAIGGPLRLSSAGFEIADEVVMD